MSNIRKGKITTVLGCIIIAVAIVLLFVESPLDLNVWAIGGIAAVGLLLLLAPDRLVGLIEKKMK